MLPILADVAVNESMMVGAAGGTLFVVVAIVRAWAQDNARWARVVQQLRSENRSLRANVRELFEQLQRVQNDLHSFRKRNPPGGEPGTEAGGPGR